MIKDGKDANAAATATIEAAIKGIAAGKYKDATDVQTHIDKLKEGMQEVAKATEALKNAVGQKARDAAKEALRKATKEVKGHEKDLRTNRQNRSPKERRAAKRDMSKETPEWARKYLEDNCNYDSSSILELIRDLDSSKRKALQSCAVVVLANKQLRHEEKLRNGAVRLIVALLPETFSIFEGVLSDSASPAWYEVHFIAFNSLERSNLSQADQQLVLALVERYLVNARSEAGFAAWKAGDMLGDEWYAPETVEILERLLSSARYVAGRNAALHGIQHAMTEATASEKQRLLALVRRVASEDPSAEVRDYANYTLTHGGCSKTPSVRG